MKLGVFLVAALASLPARAVDVAVGFEGFAYASDEPTFDQGAQVGLGIIVQERFSVDPLVLSLWEDIRYPLVYPVNFGVGPGSDAIVTSYLPIGLGLRLGYALGGWTPYFGALGSVLVGPRFTGTPVIAGGDLGLDLSLGHFLIGIEGRGEATVTELLGAHAVVEGLLSGSYRF